MYLALIQKVNIINYKTKSSIIAYLFPPAIASKSTITGNINIFEELNLNKLGLFKKHLWFGELFII